MADFNNEARALSVYERLCESLDEKEWKYTKHEEDLVVTFITRGNDLPMDCIVQVDSARQLINLYSKMPFTVKEEKRMETAVAVCAVNHRLADGSFDYNIPEGEIIFRMTASFLNSEISSVLFDYMILVSSATVDEFNDKFFALSKGVISLEEFIK